MTHILSFGGGVDSSTLLAIDLDREKAVRILGITMAQLNRSFPPIDRVVFSDTGAESKSTYRNVRAASVRMLEKGRQLHIVKREGENITQWCLRLGIVPLMPGGSHICSLKFKGEIMAKWVADEKLTDVVWSIGIEAEEGKRVSRFTKPKKDAAEYRYPLIELGLNREKCKKLLDRMSWSGVEKSSCVFCPFKTEEELRHMYHNDPVSWKLCEEVEQSFEKMSHVKNNAWIDAGEPLNKGGRAPRGMWRKNSYAEGARLFCRTKKSVRELAEQFNSEIEVIAI